MNWWQMIRPFFVANLQPTQKAFSLGSWDSAPHHSQEYDLGPVRQPAAPSGPREPLSEGLEENLKWLGQHFGTDLGSSIIIRRLSLGPLALPAAVIYIDDQIDWKHLTRTLLEPLLFAELTPQEYRTPEIIMRRLVTEGHLVEVSDRHATAQHILMGYSLLLVDGCPQATAVETKGWQNRQVDRPAAELTVRGSQEGFTEDLRINLSLVRKRLRTADLMVEIVELGKLSRSQTAILYLRSVASPRLVAEVRRRVSAIKTDYVAESGSVEQYVEDSLGLHPSILSTERPDRVAAQVAEGYVAILVANGPFALILPGTLPMFLQSAEDVYLRWPYGSFVRLVRLIAFLLALLLPGLYVAVVNFHQEMIPTGLMFAISGTREAVPLPVIMEVWMMESMFELIREAGVRVPSVIGPTIGIVGALILGQAAVQAGVISPILVIITSATALASFAIPNYNLQFFARILRFVFILVASAFGLVGTTLLLTCYAVYLSASNTLGVPWTSPVTPQGNTADAFVRLPPYMHEKRPEALHPQDSRRQPDVIRRWDPQARPQNRRKR